MVLNNINIKNNGIKSKNSKNKYESVDHLRHNAKINKEYILSFFINVKNEIINSNIVIKAKNPVWECSIIKELW